MTQEMIGSEYVCNVLKSGLRFAQDGKTNPYKLGNVSVSDIHAGLAAQDDNGYIEALTWMERSATREHYRQK